MEELWDIRRVSQYLGIKRSTLYAMIERKEIPHYRIGRFARFRHVEEDDAKKTMSWAERATKKRL